MSVVCNKEEYTNEDGLSVGIRVAHKLLTADYPERQREAVVLGLRTLRREAIKQADMLSPVLTVDWSKGFALDSTMPLNSTSLEKHQGQTQPLRKSNDPSALDERTIVDNTNATLVSMIEIIRAPNRSRKLEPQNQRKQEVQNIMLSHMLANMVRPKALYMQVYTGLVCFSGGLRLQQWSLLNKLGLVASYDTIMRVAKEAVKHKEATQATLFILITTWVNIAFDNLDFKLRFADKIKQGLDELMRALHVITSQATYRKESDKLPTSETPALATKLDAAGDAKNKLQQEGWKVLSLPAEAEALLSFQTSLVRNLLRTTSTPPTSDEAVPQGGQPDVLGPSQHSLVQSVLQDPETVCLYPKHGHEIYNGPVIEGSAATIGDIGAALKAIQQAFCQANLELLPTQLSNSEVVNTLYGECATPVWYCLTCMHACMHAL